MNAQIVLVLIRKWLEDVNRVVVPATPRLTRSLTMTSFNDAEAARSDRHSYQIINSKPDFDARENCLVPMDTL